MLTVQRMINVLGMMLHAHINDETLGMNTMVYNQMGIWCLNQRGYGKINIHTLQLILITVKLQCA